MGHDKLVCIDAQIFIWGIKRQASKNREHMIRKAESLFEYLDKEGIGMLLPSPIITEILTIVPKQKYPAIMGVINKKFIIGSLDSLAAQKAAEMLHEIKYNDPNYEKSKVDGLYPRRKMKYDFLVSAIAVANDADCIYAEDEDIHNFCGNFIDVLRIPDIPKQGQLKL